MHLRSATPRALLLATTLLLLAVALPTVAQMGVSGALLTPVALGDTAVGQPLLLLQGTLRYIDGDGNGVAAADEPAYWDIDDSNSANVGDLRLRAFRTHAAGTAVTVTDDDAGRALAGSSAWFGAASGAWYADLDASRSVTEGDVRMADASDVAPGASDLGRTLDFPASGAAPGRVAIVDADRDQRWDRGEAVYLDLDTASSPSQPTVSAGDLRLAYRAASGQSGTMNGMADEQGGDGGGVQLTGGEDDGDSGGVRGLDVVLIVLGITNLLGLAFVYTRVRDGGRPRNPFK